MEELQAMITEGVFAHRMELLSMYHSLGREMARHNLTSNDVANGTGHREKDCYYALELYKAYPNLSSVPFGKNTSWYKVTKLLPPREKNSTKKERGTANKSDTKKALG
jgi:hypothetical protein